MRIIKFTATWCQPCKQLNKLLESLEISKSIETYDIDNHTEIASDFGIRSVPTLIMLDGNIEIKRLTGVRTQQELKEWING